MSFGDIGRIEMNTNGLETLFLIEMFLYIARRKIIILYWKTIFGHPEY